MRKKLNSLKSVVLLLVLLVSLFNIQRPVEAANVNSMKIMEFNEAEYFKAQEQ